MSEEETADTSSSSQGSKLGLGAQREALSVRSIEPQIIDGQALIRRLAGKPASDVLSRISNGDPLRLYTLCASRTRERYFVIDPDRVFERALAMVAVGIEIEAESCATDGWLMGVVDRAIQSTLDHDREEENAGVPPARPEEQFRLFIQAFFIEPPLARRSAVRLNGLEERVRKCFHHLLVEGSSVDDCLAMGLGPPERLHADILAALRAIGSLSESGFEDTETAEAGKLEPGDE